MDFFGIIFDMKNGKKVPYSKTYFDTLFAAKLAEMQIKTLTGTLPLTFRTSETALRSWTIYGNNNAHNYSASGTLPLTFTTQTAGAASDWSISGNNNVGKNFVDLSGVADSTSNGVTFTVDSANGTITANRTATGTANATKTFTMTLPAGTYVFSCGENSQRDITYDCYLRVNNETIARDNPDDAPGSEFTLTTETTFTFYIRIQRSYNAQNLVFRPMIRPADTSATFEPYQIGVGQRTKNLFDYSDLEVGGYDQQTGQKISNNSIRRTANPIAVRASTIYNISNINGNIRIFEYAANGDYIGTKLITTTVTTTATTAYVTFHASIAYWNENTMFVEGSTAPATFIPYGYEIPLNVNNTAQNIYIGSTPLTAGQSISKTSTGVDIAAQVGSNTITTELYNKPEMSIEGVDYVGVGEPVNDSWQIPLTVSDGTNTTTVNVPIDAPLTDGQTVTDTVTISTFEGENTIDTSLTNKPQMSITYKGG